MGPNQRIRKRIGGLERAIEEHENKIEAERLKTHPNRSRMAYWQGEIAAWKKQIEHLSDRLTRRR